MNKRNLCAPLLICLSLISCADTSELYKGNAYIAVNFIDNRYSIWPDKLKNATIKETKNLVNVKEDGSTNGCYFAGSDIAGDGVTCYGYNQLKARHPEAVTVDGTKDGTPLYWTIPSGGMTLSNGTRIYAGADIINNGVGEWADQSPLVGVLYGQTKKLNLLNSAFSRGYLSKLYNGQIQCDAWSSYSLVELDRSGYGTFFPVELHSASYFAFSCRGGSDTPGASGGRLSRFDINVTFYKLENEGYTGTTFALDNVPLETNISAEHTSLVGFYFDEVGYDPSGVVGMSVTYSLKEDKSLIDGVYVCPTDDFDDPDATYHTGLIMLEVLFPDSEWN